MAFAFTTETHALYKVDGDKISRIGESKMYDRRVCAFVERPIMDEPFTSDMEVTPGEHFKFTLSNLDHYFGGVPTTTSRVVHIYPIVNVQYIPYCLPCPEDSNMA